MKVVSFAGGQTPGKSGMGLVGMPLILSHTAARGHQVVLVMGGLPSPGRENFLVPDLASAVRRKEGAGTFGTVCFSAWTTWSFSPAILWRLHRLIRSSDFVSLHSLYCFPILAGYFLARLHGKPYGIWPHGVLAPYQRGVSAIRKWFYDRMIGRRILEHASVLFYSARGEREETRSLGLTAPSVIVPHGFDAQEFAILPARGRFRKRHLNGHEGPLVVFLARVNGKKGVDLLIAALARVMSQQPETRLAIIGPADPRSFERRVREWLHAAGIESKAVVTGSVGPGERLEALADADVYALPSQAENFGFSIFEAMASRVPVVISDTLNYAKEISNAGAGFAVRRDAESIAKAVLQLLNDPLLRCQMGANGVRLARAYSWEANGLAVERTVESILEHRTLPADLAG